MMADDNTNRGASRVVQWRRRGSDIQLSEPFFFGGNDTVSLVLPVLRRMSPTSTNRTDNERDQ